MSIQADFHIHSYHSFDSEAKMEDMINAALNKGLKHICFTEHMDHNFPPSPEYPEGAWECNVDSYLYELLGHRAAYDRQIEVRFGLEIGLQESVIRDNAITARSHEFDFIIGSIHVVNGFDTYLPAYFEGKTTKQAILEYYETMLRNIQKFENFDVLGHIDYIVRTLPEGEGAYKPSDYMDIVDEILNIIIEREKGIEINTAALVKGFTNPNPHRDIVKRYKELGGKIITFGSDAHTPERVATHFEEMTELAKKSGFTEYYTFKKRVPTVHKLL